MLTLEKNKIYCSVTSLVLDQRDEACNFKTKDVIVCCLVSAITHIRRALVDEWSNGGTVIRRAKLNRFG
jgi:hypothetical protein